MVAFLSTSPEFLEKVFIDRLFRGWYFVRLRCAKWESDVADSAISRVVIIGSGQAAVECAAALRHQGFAGSISVIGDDPNLPYQRPPLSKEFLKSASDTSLPLRGEAFYATNNIDLRLGVAVQSIEREARWVILDNGDPVPFDHLVIATGARNRIPPVSGLDPHNVLELRTLAHARALTSNLDQLQHVVIIGGGFIGLEVAALLRQRQVEVHVVEAADRLMARVLSPMMSAEFENIHRQQGTHLHLGVVATSIDGGRISLSDGTELVTDKVVVAAGVLPNVELAAQAGLEVDNGIVVDGLLLTSDPNVSAIGDCAAHPNPWGLGVIRLESVQNAVDQAKCVASRLMGQPAPYDSLPWFWSHQGEAKLQIAGLAQGMDDAVMRGDPGSGRFSVFIYRAGHLIAVESVNSPGDHMVARRLLAAGRSIDREVASDLSIDLKALLASR